MLLYAAKLTNYELHVWQNVTFFLLVTSFKFWKSYRLHISLQSYKLLLSFEKLLLFSDARGDTGTPKWLFFAPLHILYGPRGQVTAP